jgi:hypothetical protein
MFASAYHDASCQDVQLWVDVLLCDQDVVGHEVLHLHVSFLHGKRTRTSVSLPVSAFGLKLN